MLGKRRKTIPLSDREPAHVREQLYSGRHEAEQTVLRCAMLYERAHRRYQLYLSSGGAEGAPAGDQERRHADLLAAVHALAAVGGYSPVDR